ncbi:MAG: DUF2283 domain-containing protein [Nanoarchaeota archaeon]
MKQKMHIHYDPEGDYLEVRFGKATPSYYEETGDDIFERKDEKTNMVVGYSFFNVQKRKAKQPQDIEIEIPIVS